MNLTITAFYSRLIIKYGALFIALLIVGRLLWVTGYGIYRRLYPPPPPPPAHEFGKIPKPYFPDKPGLPILTFTLQTPTGELPELPTIAKVFFMPQKSASFLGLDEAKRLAQGLGFTSRIDSLSDSIYRFQKERSSATLDINIVNKTFSISYNLATSPEILDLHPQPNEESLRAVDSLLSGANLLNPDLTDGDKTFEYLKITDKDFNTVSSLSEANFVRISFFRKKVDDLPIVMPRRDRSNVWFLVSGDTTRDKQIIAGEYHFFPIDYNKSSTYPLKTSKEAWSDLNSGQAYIAQTPSTPQTQITIRRVYLAYYDSGTPLGFLQPVVVFEGDGGFTAYVTALTGEYLTTQDPTATTSAVPQ